MNPNIICGNMYRDFYQLASTCGVQNSLRVPFLCNCKCILHNYSSNFPPNCKSHSKKLLSLVILLCKFVCQFQQMNGSQRHKTSIKQHNKIKLSKY